MAKARNGEGTIKPRKLADGTTVYDAWCSVKDPVTGKTSRPSKRGHPSEAAAVEWIQKTRASKTRRVQGMTLDDLAEMFWASGSVKSTTLSYWKRDYNKEIKPYLGAMRISEILPMHLDAWVGKIRAVQSRGKPRKASTLVKNVTVLSGVLEYGVLNRMIDANWTKSSPGVRKLREDAGNEDTKPKNIWTPEQFGDFLALETEPSYRAMWCFIAATGVRRGIACGLGWDEVDFEAKKILLGVNRVPTPEGVMVSTAKGGRRQWIFMDDLLLDVLKAQKARQDEAREAGPWEEHGVVFDRPVLRHSWRGEVFVPGRPMDPKSVTERFSRLARDAKLPDASPHNLRDVWATLARDAGFSRQAVADQLGHKSTVVTRIYDHSEVEQRQTSSTVTKIILRTA